MEKQKGWTVRPEHLTAVEIGSDMIPADEIRDITWDPEDGTMTIIYAELDGEVVKRIEAEGFLRDFKFYGCEVEE